MRRSTAFIALVPAVIEHRSGPGQADAEIAFWRGFIAWWEREKDLPVPPRAWDALALARAKAEASIEPRWRQARVRATLARGGARRVNRHWRQEATE